MAARLGMTSARAKQARALYDDGYGRNAIAREIGVSVGTVTNWAVRENLPFDRRQTAIAVRAHVVDLRAEAMLLAQKLMVAAHDTLDALDGPYTLRELGRGPEGEGDRFIELEVDDAPIEVRVKSMAAAGLATDKALKVISAYSDDRTAAAESLVDALVTGFKKQAAGYTPPPA